MAKTLMAKTLMTRTLSCILALSVALAVGGGIAWGQDAPAKDSSGSQDQSKDAKPGAKKKPNMYEALFKKLDANHDGILTREEYFAYFKKKDSAGVESSWKKMDPDGTGKVTMEQFVKVWTDKFAKKKKGG